jgi:glycosyltransferase involved in cell wall biosynthesis
MSENAALFFESVSGPSSRAQFQFVDHVCSNNRTILFTRSQRDQIPPQIADKAEKIYTPPGNKIVRRILFPLFSIIFALSNRHNIQSVYTLQGGEAVLPSYIIQGILRTTWVLLSPDVPEGRYVVIKNYSGESKCSVRRLYHNIRFRIELFAASNSDIAVYSDQSDFISFDDPKNILIKGGVDCGKIKESTVESTTNSKPLSIIYVGNMYYHRGIDIILSAMRQVDNDIQLELIGPAPETSQRNDDFNKNLDEPFVKTVDKFDNIDYLGEMDHDQVMAELDQADIGICLLPYERGVENFKYSYPIKIFEYMATGTVVLATKTEPTTDLLTESQLLSTTDSSELASAIMELNNSPQVISQLKRRNLTKGKSHCWEVLRKDLDERISELKDR